jgi:hypothetical protein
VLARSADRKGVKSFGNLEPDLVELRRVEPPDPTAPKGGRLVHSESHTLGALRLTINRPPDARPIADVSQFRF